MAVILLTYPVISDFAILTNQHNPTFLFFALLHHYEDNWNNIDNFICCLPGCHFLKQN